MGAAKSPGDERLCGPTFASPTQPIPERQSGFSLSIPSKRKEPGKEHPFFDAKSGAADLTIYWQAKLDVAEELSVVALELLGMAVSEASVERTFSYQKFLDTPLRAWLATATTQAQMFVRFNFCTFGDKTLIPEALRVIPSYMYDDLPPSDGEASDAGSEPDITSLAIYWNE